MLRSTTGRPAGEDRAQVLTIPRRTLQSLTVPLALIFGAALTASPALAADLLPLGQIDARATGTVSSGEMAKEGSVAVGIHFSSEGALLPSETASTVAREENHAVIESARRVSLLLGTSLNDSLELSLALRGTYEDVEPNSRQDLFGANDDGKKVKQSAFAGATAMAKINLLNRGGFKLGFAPFVESGVGVRGQHALTRGSAASPGWMSIMTYGSRRVGEVTSNIGYRYREPEAVGAVLLRNELFYRTLFKAHLNRELALFATGSGRRMMMASLAGPRDVMPVYRASFSSELTAGLSSRKDDMELAAFLGARLEDQGVRRRSPVGGISVTYATGGEGRARPPRTMMGSAVKSETKSKKDEVVAVEIPKPDRFTEAVLDLEANPVDPLKDIHQVSGDQDDFDQLGLRSLRESTAAPKNTELSAHDRVEQELSVLRQAEAKVEAARLERDAAQAKVDRQQKLDEFKSEQTRQGAMRKSERKKARALPEAVTEDDVSWRGLD